MMRFSVLAVVAASLVAEPSFAGPSPKRPSCQIPKSPTRDMRRELCRKAPIPPVVDPTPMYLISTTGRPALRSDLS
jgi:hypothetical protein